jgi:hypothetical protein
VQAGIEVARRLDARAAERRGGGEKLRVTAGGELRLCLAPAPVEHGEETVQPEGSGLSWRCCSFDGQEWRGFGAITGFAEGREDDSLPIAVDTVIRLRGPPVERHGSPFFGRTDLVKRGPNARRG